MTDEQLLRNAGYFDIIPSYLAGADDDSKDDLLDINEDEDEDEDFEDDFEDEYEDEKLEPLDTEDFDPDAEPEDFSELN